MASNIHVDVVYAQPESVWRVGLSLEEGSTVEQAMVISQFRQHFPNYPHAALKVGVYGRVCALDRVLADGDRIEIYRPLVFDPMESRRRRAIHRKAFMTKRLSRT